MVKKIKELLKEHWLIALGLVLLIIPAGLRLLMRGFYEPSDLHHIADIYEMFRAFQSGQIPPRLGPDYTFGWGYPLFNFYYVLPFYIGALWFWISSSLTASFKFVFFLSVIISVPSMYLFLRQYFRKFAAFTGAALYLYTPFRALEIYVRGAMGEALAISLLPLVLFVLAKIVKMPGIRNVVIAGFVIALFLLSHNYFWLLALLPIISFAVLMLFFEKDKIPRTLALVVAGVFGAGLSIYWWLPALLEQKLVFSHTPFPLIDHFPFIKQLIIPSWGFGASVPGPGDGISFQIGVVNIVVLLTTLLAIIFVRKRFSKRNLVLASWAILGFFATVFMMNIRSYPVWQLIPFYNFVQFPWRLLFLTTLFTSILSAIITDTFPTKVSKITSFLIIAGSILLTFNYFQPSHIVYKKDNEYLNRMFANLTKEGTKPSVSADYMNWSEDYLLLPQWTEERPEFLYPLKVESSTGITVSEIKENSPVSWTAKVYAQEEGKVTFFAYYFPGWYANDNGQVVALSPGKPYGQIELALSKGLHTIDISWKETPLRKSADYLSLAFLLTGFVLLIIKRENPVNK